MNVEICFSPLLYPLYKDNESIVVVVDVFRATSTMCSALKNGAISIIPVETVEEAADYKARGYLVGGERNVKKIEFADFGNTPSEYLLEKVQGKEIVLSTTNGTRALEMAKNAEQLLIGAFSNLSALAIHCGKEKKNVLILCAAWKDKINIEDTLFAGALAQRLISESGYSHHSDATEIALTMWREAKEEVYSYILRSEHIKRMEANGLLEVARYCLTPDTVDIVPIYNKETNKITILKDEYFET